MWTCMTGPRRLWSANPGLCHRRLRALEDSSGTSPRGGSASGPVCCKAIECEEFVSRVVVCVGRVNNLLPNELLGGIVGVHRCVGIGFHMWECWESH